MIQRHFTRTLLSAILYIVISLASIWVINPQSIVNFIGPAAALISGLFLIWGAIPLVAVLLASPILAFSISYYFQLDVDLAVMIISVLTIVLQGFWTKQLVFRFVKYKKWLTSRIHLFFFLLRIGPIGSLVSASSVLVISILDNEAIHGNFFYTFINTWSASMLMAVFFIPLLLMTNNSEGFPLTKRLFVGVTSILGGLAIFILLKTSQYEQQHYRQALFKQSKVEIERLITAEIDTVANKVNSMSALFKASEEVLLKEFNLFSESIYKHNSSVRALEWAPIISASQREEFEKKSSIVLQRKIKIKERLINGGIREIGPKKQYAPLYYIYPEDGNETALGLDIYSNPKHILSMRNVIDSRNIVASAPITLHQDQLSTQGLLFSKAVFSPVNQGELDQGMKPQNLSLIKEGKLIGFVVGVAQFDRFFDRLAKNSAFDVSFFIQDISSRETFTLFGQALPTVNRNVERVTIPVFSRFWQITIAEKEPWFNQPKSFQAWAVLVGGTFGAVLFQMLVLMMAAYSRELAQQVSVKTGALILAKERSEQKSLAKSNFLQTLNAELRVPLLAITSFVDQLKKKGINNKEVTGINHASSNITLLLDTMVDLSNIESGKVTAKEDCFDFYGFLQRTESVIKGSSHYEGKSTFFLIDESVPHYLNSDELYIQKLLHALIESAHQLLKTDTLRLSVKLHKNSSNPSNAILFFTLSPQHDEISGLDDEDSNQVIKPVITDSTSFAMAIKYSQLLRGDTNLGALSTGKGVLNSSIQVTISSIEQQEFQQGLTFDLPN